MVEIAEVCFEFHCGHQKLAACYGIPETGNSNAIPHFFLSMDNRLMGAKIGVASI